MYALQIVLLLVTARVITAKTTVLALLQLLLLSTIISNKYSIAKL